MRKINHIQIHHSATDNKIFKANNHIKIWNSFKRFHMKKGWFDIAYHFGIFPDGKILSGRAIKYKPAGIAFHNTGGIALCMVGNFDKKEPDEIQYTETIKLTAKLMKEWNIDKIVFHRDFTNRKYCPGLLINKFDFIKKVYEILEE